MQEAAAPKKASGGIQGQAYNKLPFMDLVQLCRKRNLKFSFPRKGMNNQERCQRVVEAVRGRLVMKVRGMSGLVQGYVSDEGQR